MKAARSIGIGTLVGALAVAPAIAGTPFGGDDTGFIPPNKTVAKCENAVVKSHAKAIACILECHKKRATGALADEAAEDACEKTRRSSCKAKYDAITDSASKIDALCSPCLDASARENFFGLIEAALDALNHDVYCSGTTAWGGDDTGFLPPDANSAKCETSVAKAIGKAALCITACHVARASNQLADDVAEDECESGTSRSSCKNRYSRATANLDRVCPSCLDGNTRADLFDTINGLLDADNKIEYCASPSAAFVERPSDPARRR